MSIRGKQSIKNAAFITFFYKYATIIVNLLSNAILARLLTPDDFGVVTIINVFVTFFVMISDMGIGAAIVQKRELEKEDIDSIYTFTIYLGIILVGGFLIISNILSKVYDDQIYQSLGYLLSGAIFFNTINVVPNSLLLKVKKFRKIGIRTFVVNIVSVIFAINLALKGYRYYSLIGQTILSSIVIFIWNYIETKPKYRIKIYWCSIRKIVFYSLNLFGYNTINYFARNFDNLLIGKYFGPVKLGYYDKAYKLALYPVQSITYVINPVLHPFFSEFQNDKMYLYQQYIKILKVLSLTGVFITAYFINASDEIVIILFGEQWNNAILCCKILSFSIWFQMMAATVGVVYASLGKTHLAITSAIIFVPIQIVVLIPALLTGKIEGIALAALAGLIVKFFVEYYTIIKKGFGYTIKKFMFIFLPDFVLCVCILLIFKILTVFNVPNIFFSALFKLVIGGLGYLLLLFISKQYRHLIPLFSWR